MLAKILEPTRPIPKTAGPREAARDLAEGTSLLDTYEPLEDGPLAVEFFIRLRHKIYRSLDEKQVPYHREYGRLATGVPYFFVQPFNEKGWLFESNHGGWTLSKAAKIYGDGTFIREGTPLEQAQLRLPVDPSPGSTSGLVYPRVASEVFQESGMALALYEAKLAELLGTLLDPYPPYPPPGEPGSSYKRWTSLLLMGILVAATSDMSLAGPYFTGGLRSAQFAAKPQSDEPTPNYYGFGLRLGAGYSVRQVFDMGLYGSGLSARRGSPGVSRPDATLVHGGAEFGLRIAKSLLISLYGGPSQYRLERPSDQLAPGVEVTSALSGYGGGVGVGAIVPFSKEKFLQVTLDFEQHHFQEKSQDNTIGLKRVFESFGLTLSLTFNSYKSYLIDNTIFKDFLDSVNF